MHRDVQSGQTQGIGGGSNENGVYDGSSPHTGLPLPLNHCEHCEPGFSVWILPLESRLWAPEFHLGVAFAAVLISPESWNG